MKPAVYVRIQMTTAHGTGHPALERQPSELIGLMRGEETNAVHNLSESR